MTDHWTGAIRRAAEQDGEGYCRDCLVDDGPDAAPLTDYGNTPVAADRAAQDTQLLGDTLHVFGWVCDRHDTLCVRDPWEFESPVDGMLTVVLPSEQDGEIVGHVPVHDLERDRWQYYHPENDDLEHPDADKRSENRSSDSSSEQATASDGGVVTSPEPGDGAADESLQENYDHVIELGDDNAPKSCYQCGDPAGYYLTAPGKFTCGDSACRP